MANKMQNDEACIELWRELNGRFMKLIEGEPAPDKIKKELALLREEVANKNSLTYRQTGSLIAKIDNYSNGTFGNTKAGVTFKGA